MKVENCQSHSSGTHRDAGSVRLPALSRTAEGVRKQSGPLHWDYTAPWRATRQCFPPVGLNDNQLDPIQRELLGHCNQIQPTYFPILNVEKYEGKNLIVLWAPGGHTPSGCMTAARIPGRCPGVALG